MDPSSPPLLPPVVLSALGRLGRRTLRRGRHGSRVATLMTAIGPARLVIPAPVEAGSRTQPRVELRYWFAGTAAEADPAIGRHDGLAGTWSIEPADVADWLRRRRATGSPALLAENLLVAVLRPAVWLLRVTVIAAITAVLAAVLAALLQRPRS